MTRPLTVDDVRHALARGDQLATVADAARTVGVTRHTVNNWIRRGHVPAVTVDGVRMVLLDDVSALEYATRQATVGRPRRVG